MNYEKQIIQYGAIFDAINNDFFQGELIKPRIMVVSSSRLYAHYTNATQIDHGDNSQHRLTVTTSFQFSISPV